MSLRILFAPIIALLGIAGACAIAQSPGAGTGPVLPECNVSVIDDVQIPAQSAGVIVPLDKEKGIFQISDGANVTQGEIVARLDAVRERMALQNVRLEEKKSRLLFENDVEIRYVKKLKELNYVTWQKSEEANRKVPGSVPAVERSRLKLEFEQAELQIEQREKDKELARHDWALQSLAVEAANDAVRRREIVSPIDGIVVSVFPKVGEWVREGDPVVRIVSLKQLRVDGYLNIREYAPHEVRGRKVTVTAKLTGDKPASFSGTLVFAHPETQGNGEYRVKAIVDNRLVDDEYLLRPGLVVDMKIHMNEPKVRISAR